MASLVLRMLAGGADPHLAVLEKKPRVKVTR